MDEKLKTFEKDVGTKIVRKQLGCEKKNATVEPDSFLEKVDRKFVGLAKTFLKI